MTPSTISCRRCGGSIDARARTHQDVTAVIDVRAEHVIADSEASTMATSAARATPLTGNDVPAESHLPQRTVR